MRSPPHVAVPRIGVALQQLSQPLRELIAQTTAGWSRRSFSARRSVGRSARSALDHLQGLCGICTTFGRTSAANLLTHSIIGCRRRTTRRLPSPSSPAPETLQRPDALGQAGGTFVDALRLATYSVAMPLPQRLRPALPAHQSAATTERRHVAARDQARRPPPHRPQGRRARVQRLYIRRGDDLTWRRSLGRWL